MASTNDGLSGPDAARLRDQIVDAFGYDELIRFALDHLDADIRHFSKMANTLEMAFDLIEWAERRGQVDDLIRGLRQERPEKRALVAICDEIEGHRRSVTGTDTTRRRGVLRWLPRLSMAITVSVSFGLALTVLVTYPDSSTTRGPSTAPPDPGAAAPGRSAPAARPRLFTEPVTVTLTRRDKGDGPDPATRVAFYQRFTLLYRGLDEIGVQGRFDIQRDLSGPTKTLRRDEPVEVTFGEDRIRVTLRSIDTRRAVVDVVLYPGSQ